MRMAKNFIRLSAIVSAAVTAFAIMDFALAAQKPVQQLKEERKLEPIEKKEVPRAKKQKQLSKEELDRIKLPEDTSPRLKVEKIRFSGNTLVSTKQLLADLPVIFNASDKSLANAESRYLYDFRPLQELFSTPRPIVEVSTRMVSGLTQYVLSVYQQKNYGGIYVYVPADVLKGNELKDGILQINIIESRVTNVGTKFYDVNQTLEAKGYLDANTLKAWSPVKPGGIVNQKQLDDFLNLLNLNPDRYITATVSKGTEPNSLAVDYGIYEVNPWHYFIQIDNSGTRETRWNPKIGVINTDLLGFDDQFMAVYQFRPDSTWNDNYSLYGSYDFPIAGPGLRLNIYGGYSEFDVSSSSSDISFLGAGKFIGCDLRYNLSQTDDWFFDVIGTFSHEESRVTPSLFPEDLGNNIIMNLLGAGAEIHKRDDAANTSLGYKFITNTGGSDSEEFDKTRPPAPPAGPGAEKYFTIHTFTATHSRFLDSNMVSRLNSTLRWIVTEDRLPPAKMTSFGGMYTVRGYKEYETIADEGVIASAQYEFDLVKYGNLRGTSDTDKKQTKIRGLKKFAPLVFTDYGRAKINSPVTGEKEHETLYSVGFGTIAEYGGNLSAAVYYGIAMRDTERTDAGNGRVNVSFMLRW